MSPFSDISEADLNGLCLGDLKEHPKARCSLSRLHVVRLEYETIVVIWYGDEAIKALIKVSLANFTTYSREIRLGWFNVTSDIKFGTNMVLVPYNPNFQFICRFVREGNITFIVISMLYRI